jgi:hypothetical protein
LNLILLCPKDHRLVDTLISDYPAERLREIKQTHEAWVAKTLERPAGVSAVTVVHGEPRFLHYLGTAREVLAVTASADESSLDYEELSSNEEVDLIAGFLQRVHDDSEMWDEYEPADQVRCTFDLDREIQEREARGWSVFGARARGRIRGGVAGGEASWDCASIRLVRAHSSTIIKIDPRGRLVSW